MGFFQLLFGKHSSESQSDQNSLSKQLIAEASDIAEKGVDLKQSGTIWSVSTNTDVGRNLVEAIDKALANSPNNAELLLARYAAFNFAYHCEDANEVLQQAIDKDPNNFDAKMLRDYPQSWQTLFDFPAWSEDRKVLHPVMIEWLNKGQSLQIIRDGLEIGVSVVNPAKSDNFPSSIRRSAWKLIWTRTPHGHIAFHYSLIDCGADKVYKQEAGVPHIADAAPTVRSGYWLLRRLFHVKSCFIVYADGNKVLYNSKYVFPNSLRTSLAAMDKDLEALGEVRSASSCQAAANWYMQNVDFASIKF